MCTIYSFNDTGDRALTTLARQPTYPSMPLNDSRISIIRKEPMTPNQPLPKRSCLSRYSSLADEHTCQAVDTANRLATLRRGRSCRSEHHGTIARHSSYLDDKSVSLVGHLLVSPTYGMYNSAVKGGYDYFLSNDEAVSRF